MGGVQAVRGVRLARESEKKSGRHLDVPVLGGESQQQALNAGDGDMLRAHLFRKMVSGRQRGGDGGWETRAEAVRMT